MQVTPKVRILSTQPCHKVSCLQGIKVFLLKVKYQDLLVRFMRVNKHNSLYQCPVRGTLWNRVNNLFKVTLDRCSKSMIQDFLVLEAHNQFNLHNKGQ